MPKSNLVSSPAERIAEAMTIRHTTASELSKAIGISKSTMSYYLKGKFLPKQDKLYAIGKELRVNPAWLMGYDIPMEGDFVSNYLLAPTSTEEDKRSAKEALASIKQENKAVYKPLRKLLIALSDQTPNESETELLCDYRKLSSEQKQTVAALIKTLLQSN